jgi:hypothetical protein
MTNSPTNQLTNPFLPSLPSTAVLDSKIYDMKKQVEVVDGADAMELS